MTDTTPTTTPAELLAQLRAAAALPDDEISRSDIDAPFGTDWTKGVRGRFYRPFNKPEVADV